MVFLLLSIHKAKPPGKPGKVIPIGLAFKSWNDNCSCLAPVPYSLRFLSARIEDWLSAGEETVIKRKLQTSEICLPITVKDVLNELEFFRPFELKTVGLQEARGRAKKLLERALSQIGIVLRPISGHSWFLAPICCKSG